MAKKTGNLQRAIIEKLHSCSHLPILQNRLLWDLAFERDEIKKSGIAYGPDNEIEDGLRKKSFEINFRRAVRGLSDDGKISLSTRSLFELDEILELMPYLTDKLEIFKIRTLLLPAVKKFISEENPEIQHKDLDPFGFQIETLKDNNRQTYKQLVKKWRGIETKIVKILQDTDNPFFDSWIESLMCGRFYFRTVQKKYPFYLSRTKNPYRFKLPDTNALQENDVIADIKTLKRLVESHQKFKVGRAKMILYTLFSAPRFGNTTITDDLKKYLFKEEKELLKSLPGDKDSHFQGGEPARDEFNFRNREFSKLLDQLFTRHIFRELSFVNRVKV